MLKKDGLTKRVSGVAGRLRPHEISVIDMSLSVEAFVLDRESA